MKRNLRTPPPAFRVFISSTYTDMRPYREAIANALNKADCIPCGMERFGASPIPPLQTCFKELEKSQIYLCALGMRYGSIDTDSGKSYTHLEYEKAKELGLPILAFLIDEDNVKINIRDVDRGEAGEKLEAFKREIKESKEVTCAFFDSPMALQELVYRSVVTEMKRNPAYIRENNEDLEDYILGAKKFRQFVRRPERYKNQEMMLRVRMDGEYGGWKIKDQLFEAYGLRSGEALYLKDLWVIGLESIDVSPDLWSIDCFAADEAADWLDDNDITTGSVFEGVFRTMYETVPNISDNGDAKIAKLRLLRGSSVIEHNVISPQKVLIDRLLEEM